VQAAFLMPAAPLNGGPLLMQQPESIPALEKEAGHPFAGGRAELGDVCPGSRPSAATYRQIPKSFGSLRSQGGPRWPAEF